jgi:hypothetical protein
MSLTAFIEGLRVQLAGQGLGRPRLTLQYLGLSDEDLRALRPMVERAGESLGVRLSLQRSAGDIVVVDERFAAQVSPQILNAYCEERPVVSVDGDSLAFDEFDAALDRLERCQEALLRQLRAIPLVRRSVARAAGKPQSREAESGFDSQFDSRLDASRLAAPSLASVHEEVVTRLLAGMVEPSASPLTLSYGPGATMVVDFEAGLVRSDPLAQQHLRVQRELPLPAPEACPGLKVSVRTLDETVWDMGIACGRYKLLEQPEDWWHTPLEAARLVHADRYTRTPRMLEMARCLADSPVTPAELRRYAAASVSDVRCFVQACLFLGLAYWAPWRRS